MFLASKFLLGFRVFLFVFFLIFVFLFPDDREIESVCTFSWFAIIEESLKVDSNRLEDRFDERLGGAPVDTFLEAFHLYLSSFGSSLNVIALVLHQDPSDHISGQELEDLVEPSTKRELLFLPRRERDKLLFDAPGQV